MYVGSFLYFTTWTATKIDKLGNSWLLQAAQHLHEPRSFTHHYFHCSFMIIVTVVVVVVVVIVNVICFRPYCSWRSRVAWHPFIDTLSCFYTFCKNRNEDHFNYKNICSKMQTLSVRTPKLNLQNSSQDLQLPSECQQQNSGWKRTRQPKCENVWNWVSLLWSFVLKCSTLAKNSSTVIWSLLDQDKCSLNVVDWRHTCA